MSAERLLARLDRVTQSAPDRWRACSQRTRRDIARSHWRSGNWATARCCSSVSTVAVPPTSSPRSACSCGDLFPEKPGPHRPAGRVRIDAGEVLALIDHEVTVAMLILQDVIERRAISAAGLRPARASRAENFRRTYLRRASQGQGGCAWLTTTKPPRVLPKRTRRTARPARCAGKTSPICARSLT